MRASTRKPRCGDARLSLVSPGSPVSPSSLPRISRLSLDPPVPPVPLGSPVTPSTLNASAKIDPNRREWLHEERNTPACIPYRDDLYTGATLCAVTYRIIAPADGLTRVVIRNALGISAPPRNVFLFWFFGTMLTPNRDLLASHRATFSGEQSFGKICQERRAFVRCIHPCGSNRSGSCGQTFVGI